MRLILDNCFDAMKTLDENSVDAIVTDPPYGLKFMGKKWDYDVPSKEIWTEALRVLKPGGYLLSFGGSRTYHRMAVAIEDAGFEIRDQIMWVYGSGFPKSHNIGKAVDKLQGNEREVTGIQEREGRSSGILGKKVQITRELSTGISEWEGWGTALKPAHEPIVVARKPLSEKTVAKNVLKWGTGGINIDESRVDYQNNNDLKQVQDKLSSFKGAKHKGISAIIKKQIDDGYRKKWTTDKQFKAETNQNGRFPANFIHDGSDEVVGLFPNNSQRFFYCAKASKRERNAGCEGLKEKHKSHITSQNFENSLTGSGNERNILHKNNHPTVKPIALMEYLIKLVSRDGATILDPFMGSGTTGIACKNLGFDFIGIELNEEYMKIAESRINAELVR
jgi:site-specific DNA-methyltransferase (adenine-specific)